MKRKIAMLLTLVLLLSALPFGVFAAEEDDGFVAQLPCVTDQQELVDSDEILVVSERFGQEEAMASAAKASYIYESEPNGAKETADPIGYHTEARGVVSGDDLDAFVLTVTEESWLCVNFFFTYQRSLCVLYNSTLEVLAYGMPGPNNSSYAGSFSYYVSPGTYYIVMETTAPGVEYVLQIGKNLVYRIFGSTRYDTSFEIANQLLVESNQDKFQAIVVACGTNFPDALAGTYLAARKNAPILLTNGNNIRALNTYIRENLVEGGTVYLLGDSSVVPNGIGADFQVKRLGGATRYETNLQILKEAGVAGMPILVCTGTGFADSLSASATGLPILLVKNSLTAAQKELLQTANGDIYIIGGTSVVSKSLENDLKNYGSVIRLGGANRYETSILVAKTFFGEKPNIAVLAYAQNFPDGLCGGPLAHCLNSPLILTAPGKENAAVTYSANAGIAHGYVLGGGSLIPDQTVRKIYGLEPNYSIEKTN